MHSDIDDVIFNKKSNAAQRWVTLWLEHGGRMEDLVYIYEMEAPYIQLLENGPTGFGTLPSLCRTMSDEKILSHKIWDGYWRVRNKLLSPCKSLVIKKSATMKMPVEEIGGLPWNLPFKWYMEFEYAGKRKSDWWMRIEKKDSYPHNSELQDQLKYAWYLGIGGPDVPLLSAARDAFMAGYLPIKIDAKQNLVHVFVRSDAAGDDKHNEA
jgi:hypothetical protein